MQINHQNGFVMSTRRHHDPGEVCNEWGAGENARVLYECESLKKKGNTELTFPTATARRRKKTQEYRRSLLPEDSPLLAAQNARNANNPATSREIAR